MRIVRQVLDRMPAGDYRIQDKKVTPPPRARIDESMEALIHHFKLFTEGFKVPEGEVYVAVESPRGELGCYMVSDGSAPAVPHAHPRPVVREHPDAAPHDARPARRRCRGDHLERRPRARRRRPMTRPLLRSLRAAVGRPARPSASAGPPVRSAGATPTSPSAPPSRSRRHLRGAGGRRVPDDWYGLHLSRGRLRRVVPWPNPSRPTRRRRCPTARSSRSSPTASSPATVGYHGSGRDDPVAHHRRRREPLPDLRRRARHRHVRSRAGRVLRVVPGGVGRRRHHDDRRRHPDDPGRHDLADCRHGTPSRRSHRSPPSPERRPS